MAVTNDRNTLERQGSRFAYEVAANAVIHAGTIVCLQAGAAVPGAATAGLVTVGIAQDAADNSGGAKGARSVQVRTGTFLLANAATDAVTAAEIGADCFVFDNETVAKSNGGTNRPKAGRVRAVEPGGVWVTIA
ncbi:MAG: hypothetical protein Q4G22_04755 [Paracoccus sp. (in: a-proteobacteria)]|uniref:hypothetical protein n=1 Tax=Paracoccus sp. TaxID=267 RepID=UPI0026DEADCD|nr:hypothetical protein [Paracoccus sp. (in: a-proteobacteria)]MDO5631129.1 hypothetical protein [Paracoccus sp. (in: a-proteobacteria)]